MSKIISVDPSSAKPNAVAIWEEGKLVDTVEVAPTIHAISTFVEDHYPFHLAIETQFALRNVATMTKLVEIRAYWEALTLVNGGDVWRINPSEWQKKLLKREGDKRVKSAEYKNRAILRVKGTYDLEVKDDMADAICIGEYVQTYFKDLEVIRGQ